MTDPLDGELRRITAQLSECAPMAPSVEELRSRPSPARRRSPRIVPIVALTAILASVLTALALLPGSDDRPTEVATEGRASGSADVDLDNLVVTYVPPGFRLEDDSTESIPASFIPDPQSTDRIVPQGTAGTQRTQRYNRGNAPGTRAVIYLRAFHTPDRVQTTENLMTQVRGAQPATVSGKPAVIGLPEEGQGSSVDIRWVESPHVVVILTARGPIDAEEVRRMADTVAFNPSSSGTPLPPPPGAVPTTTFPETSASRLRASATRPDAFGPVFVGMSFEQVRGAYGDGTTTDQPPPCPYLAYTDSSATVLFTASSGSGVDMVTLTGGRFLTDRTVGIGSPVADVIRAYGEELHGRLSSVNGVPSSGRQTLIHLPVEPRLSDYATAFEIDGGVVVSMRTGSRQRVAGGGRC
jgi:hypothetical protein